MGINLKEMVVSSKSRPLPIWAPDTVHVLALLMLALKQGGSSK